MTKIYTYAKAKESFDLLFQKAFDEGKVKIRKNNQVFVLMPETKDRSPLDVKGVDIDMTIDEIISCIHESRKL